MSTAPNVHLRGFRKRSSLTQSDLARLLGHVSGSSISRLESGGHAPDLKTAFLLEAVFGASASQLFRTTFLQIADAVRDRADLLDDSLSLQSDSADIRRRRSELKAIVARLQRLSS
jgi:DNA-binding XRE family transcriptional regulator